MWEHNWFTIMDNKYKLANTNTNNMRGINHIVIGKQNDDFIIKWVLNITLTKVKRKSKNGIEKEYDLYSTIFPKELLDYLGADDELYLYDYFEKICISKDKPNNYPSKKIRTRLTITKNSKRYDLVKKYGGRTITLPKSYWDLSTEHKVEIKLLKKQDYAFPNNSLILIDVITPSEEAE